MRNRVILAAVILGALSLVQTNRSEADSGKYWEGVWGFEDCYYSCGNNSGDEKCTCSVHKLT